MLVYAAWFIYIATAGIPVKAENKDRTKNNWIKGKRQLKNRLKEHFSTIILLSINHRHTGGYVTGILLAHLPLPLATINTYISLKQNVGLGEG